MTKVFLKPSSFRNNWPREPDLFNYWCVQGYEIEEYKVNRERHSAIPSFQQKLPASEQEAFQFIDRWQAQNPILLPGSFCRLSAPGLAAAYYLRFKTGALERYSWPVTFPAAVEFFSLRFEIIVTKQLVHDYQANGVSIKSYKIPNADCLVTSDRHNLSTKVENISGFLLRS